MFSIQLLTPILIAFVSDVYHPNCMKFKIRDKIDEFRTGDFCNTSMGPSIVYASGDVLYALSTSGHVLGVTQRDLSKILNAAIGHELIDVNFYGSPILILMRFVHSSKAIQKLKEKYSFNHMNLDKGGCARNGFFAFSLKDSVKVVSYPYEFNITFGQPIGVVDDGINNFPSNLIRDKRSLTCEGAGIGVGYGVGVTVVGVAVKTWCDTKDLEFSITDKYNKKFDDLAQSSNIEVTKIKEGFKDMESMIASLGREESRFDEGLKEHYSQIKVLKEDLINLDHWFQNENQEIKYKLNWMGSHINYELLMTQVSILYNILMDRITLAIELWSQNSKLNKCSLYNEINPGDYVKFSHLMGVKQLTVENIDVKGKLNHLLEFVDTMAKLQTNLSSLVRKGLVVSNGILYNSEHGIIGTIESMKGLISLNQEALRHLVLKDTSWRTYTVGGLKIAFGTILIMFSIIIYVTLKTKHYHSRVIVRQVEFLHVLLFFLGGLLSIVEGVLTMI